MQKTIYDEAEEKGRVEEGRSLMLLQLETKFGSLPDRSRRKVEQFTLDDINRLAMQIVTANDRRELGL